MAKLSRQQRQEIARTRLMRILQRHTVANARTLEQKISDAGPNPQRVDPHILTGARKTLIDEGAVASIQKNGTTWYYRTDIATSDRDERLQLLAPIFQDFTKRSLVVRTGQTLEIATFRALSEIHGEFFGYFHGLVDHDDSKPYSKQEPPQHIGALSIPKGRNLDFLVRHHSAGWLGIECKNVREWLYPDREEVRATLAKCIAIDAVPVLVARRIPYVTFRLLNTCGVIIHQTYNQLLPLSAQEIADKAKHKDLLGYHDIRTGNIPDARLKTFISKNMLSAANEARERFTQYKDLLQQFADGMPYAEFAARVRRRERGLNEDHDWDNEDELSY